MVFTLIVLMFMSSLLFYLYHHTEMRLSRIKNKQIRAGLVRICPLWLPIYHTKRTAGNTCISGLFMPSYRTPQITTTPSGNISERGIVLHAPAKIIREPTL